ncbi:Alpha-1,3-arabinosyltransferase XAT3 [Thalictrum thalictroides]|uniref:Alpha-1,3-arabinosyltransferase XAT3 n=1 Tax=Thalictrum thalictroides TaxID=46969 RepID=A0A7J6X3Z9_THATH|nr:Alpha-1,3-arabinosyltransferase XAT3 [Thalictrum thalictroides]
MVQHQRYHQLKKGFQLRRKEEEDDEESQTKIQNQTLVLDLGNTTSYFKRTKPKLLPLLFFFTFVSCILIFLPRLISLNSLGMENVGVFFYGEEKYPLCSSVAYGSICCDRSSIRSDICFMNGDVRTNSNSSSIFVYSPKEEDDLDLLHEKVKPYTRKWETSIMDTIDELDLVVKKKGSEVSNPCEVQHSVPAIVFSTGGYTGNVYHEFNDGLIPLYITSQHLNKNVVFVMLEYHEWWMTKYGDVISHLSKYPPIDFSNDKRTHCFPEVIVGLRIHDELTIDPSLMQGNKSIGDFHNVLDRAYWPRIQGLVRKEKADARLSSPPASSVLKEVDGETDQVIEKRMITRPKLVVLSRNGSRAITNQHLLVGLAEEIGFDVKVLKPDRTTELAKTYRVLNSSDVMIGVHGAAMTHFLFMKPKTVFIQVIPLGTDWAAETYYGEPSRKLGLEYIGYNILPRESSLYSKYNKDDPVLRDPASVNAKGWQFTKKIYLDGQNVRLDLRRFRKRLVRAFDYTISKRD